MDLELGKSYRTRDGRKATVVGSTGSLVYPFWVEVDGKESTHTAEGTHFLSCASGRDLVDHWDYEATGHLGSYLSGYVRESEWMACAAEYGPSMADRVCDHLYQTRKFGLKDTPNNGVDAMLIAKRYLETGTFKVNYDDKQKNEDMVVVTIAAATMFVLFIVASLHVM